MALGDIRGEGGASLDGLVRAAADGDDQAFREIFRRYYGRVWRIAFSRLTNRADADDAAADAFMRLHRSLGRYRPREGASFDAYVAKLADRAAIDVHRRQRRHGHAPLEAGHEPAAASDGSGLSPAMVAALGTLPPADRDLLFLRLVDGYTSDEVALMTGRTPGAVRVAQHRALVRLRRSLGKERG